MERSCKSMLKMLEEAFAEGRKWNDLSYEEKNHQLFLRQKALLDGFLEHGAITQAQYDKSLHDLTVKMGMAVS